MCEASVYILKGDKEELFLDSVDILEPQEGGKIYMRNLEGVQRVITAQIKRIRLVEHKIVIEKTEG
ncbi:MAG: CooT family nickel-binding protein [Nitrospirae bacterium]|nr:CooT family nickel-binding protein [Nitrospirota bacterium]